jgi:predicted GIY-YIG superfamily endonuclease
MYMMQSTSRRALYIGMTNNLHRRVWQHKTHAFEGFTDDYNAARLVYWESFDDVQCYQSRKAAEELAAGKETVVDRNHEPALARPRC